ncbi:MAG TPA: hypothetical protein VKK79_13280 [Candidatus Lokiarchaeia archaeon]|nr:hypothetical protein [Candidatus Lokiarchaeia archaeon]
MPETIEETDNFIIDSKQEIVRKGTYSGAIIIRPNNPFESLILADNLTIGDTLQVDGGLLVGVRGSEAFSREVNFEASPPFQTVDYAVQINPDIMESFDQGSLASSFPYTISFLHTALLWYQAPEENSINHLDFVRGEILARPVACDIEGGIIVGDRLVINQSDTIFYNSFVVSRSDSTPLGVYYEPMLSMGERFLKFIVILGSENLKKVVTS